MQTTTAMCHRRSQFSCTRRPSAGTGAHSSATASSNCRISVTINQWAQNKTSRIVLCPFYLVILWRFPLSIRHSALSVRPAPKRLSSSCVTLSDYLAVHLTSHKHPFNVFEDIRSVPYDDESSTFRIIAIFDKRLRAIEKVESLEQFSAKLPKVEPQDWKGADWTEGWDQTANPVRGQLRMILTHTT